MISHLFCQLIFTFLSRTLLLLMLMSKSFSIKNSIIENCKRKLILNMDIKEYVRKRKKNVMILENIHKLYPNLKMENANLIHTSWLKDKKSICLQIYKEYQLLFLIRSLTSYLQLYISFAAVVQSLSLVRLCDPMDCSMQASLPSLSPGVSQYS